MFPFSITSRLISPYVPEFLRRGEKQPQRDADHSKQLRGWEWVELYLCSRYTPSWSGQGKPPPPTHNTLFTLISNEIRNWLRVFMLPLALHYQSVDLQLSITAESLEQLQLSLSLLTWPRMRSPRTFQSHNQQLLTIYNITQQTYAEAAENKTNVSQYRYCTDMRRFYTAPLLTAYINSRC